MIGIGAHCRGIIAIGRFWGWRLVAIQETQWPSFAYPAAGRDPVTARSLSDTQGAVVNVVSVKIWSSDPGILRAMRRTLSVRSDGLKFTSGGTYEIKITIHRLARLRRSRSRRCSRSHIRIFNSSHRPSGSKSLASKR